MARKKMDSDRMSVRMRGFKKYTPLNSALKIILSPARNLPSEPIVFHAAAGRVLAENIIAKNNVPSFDRSAVDGFAVRASDTFGASQTKALNFRIVGSARAGVPSKARVGRREAVKLMTGAPIPKGADAVVMVENTKSRGNTIDVLSPVTPGKNVSKRGEDVRAGEAVLRKGKFLQPHDIGMLASVGAERIKVFRKPEVAIITTGEELVEPGAKIPPAKIIDSNLYSLAAAVNKSGGDPHFMGRVRDDPKAIENAIKKSLRHDVVLVSGGSSVGEFDLVPDTISRMGRILFHGVSIRPGGPTAFGIVREKPVFSLAGFPVATLVAFHMLARPALLKMQGLKPDHGRRTLKAELTRDVSSTIGRTDVVRVKLRRAGARTLAEPVRITGSSILSTMTSADGFVLIPENSEGLRKGTSVEVELF